MILVKKKKTGKERESLI